MKNRVWDSKLCSGEVWRIQMIFSGNDIEIKNVTCGKQTVLIVWGTRNVTLWLKQLCWTELSTLTYCQNAFCVFVKTCHISFRWFSSRGQWSCIIMLYRLLFHATSRQPGECREAWMQRSRNQLNDDVLGYIIWGLKNKNKSCFQWYTTITKHI